MGSKCERGSNLQKVLKQPLSHNKESFGGSTHRARDEDSESIYPPLHPPHPPLSQLLIWTAAFSGEMDGEDEEEKDDEEQFAGEAGCRMIGPRIGYRETE